MGKINLLSQETIDKIAAGEVVERPASVAKELIENSIDAGATAISVEIKGGGVEYLRITDNGYGIEKDQIPIAFMRHSTSKISSAEDLNDVRSLGFRGEALSSISAVAKVELITKTKESMLGCSYIIEGAKEISLTDVGAPDGTTFIIRQLFYNTPARKKFLKSESTEGSYVFDVVEHLALSHPEISFKFLLNGKEKLMTSGNGVLSDTIYQIYGRQIASNVLDLYYQDENIKISGFIGQSVIARGNRAFEHFFVNNRYIKSANLSRACEEGYYGFLMGHQYPFFVINIDFETGSVDVNVHPTKQEVRFENESMVTEVLTKIINKRLRKREDVLEAHVEEPPVKAEPLITPAMHFDRTSVDNVNSEPVKESEPIAIKQKMPEPFERNRLEDIKKDIVNQIKQDTPYEKKFAENNYGGEKYEQITFLKKEAIKEHKIIGQVFDTYWIVEYDKNMYIIDQHAAHERIMYERVKANYYNEDTKDSQLMLLPDVITLTHKEMDILRDNMDMFKKAGFTLEEFGDNTIKLSGVPNVCIDLDTKELFLETLDEINTVARTAKQEIEEKFIATVACKAAVKAHMALTKEEVDSLMKKLLKLPNPFTCPHGRPTAIKMSRYDIERRFHRK